MVDPWSEQSIGRGALVSKTGRMEVELILRWSSKVVVLSMQYLARIGIRHQGLRAKGWHMISFWCGRGFDEMHWANMWEAISFGTWWVMRSWILSIFGASKLTVIHCST